MELLTEPAILVVAFIKIDCLHTHVCGCCSGFPYLFDVLYVYIYMYTYSYVHVYLQLCTSFIIFIIFISYYFSYRIYVLVLTFCCYAAYHMSRKPFSVVAVSIAEETVHDMLIDDSMLCNKDYLLNVLQCLNANTNIVFIYSVYIVQFHSIYTYTSSLLKIC